MFKLLKIENSHVSAPEIIKLPKIAGHIIPAGSLLASERGFVVTADHARKMELIAVATAGAGDNYVSCYRIKSDMIFEAPADKNANYVVGDSAGFMPDENGTEVIGILAGEDQDLKIVDASELKTKGTVKFRFTNRAVG